MIYNNNPIFSVKRGLYMPPYFIGSTKSVVMNFSTRKLLFLLCFISFATITNAQQWNGSVNNNWAEPGNWNGGAVPTGAAHVRIPKTYRNPVITAGTDALARSITIYKNARLSINANATLTINNSNSIGINNNEGKVFNYGTIDIQTTGDWAIWNFFNSSFNNYGTIKIGLTGNPGRGIFNAHSMVNHGSGLIQIDRCTWGAGIDSQGGFTNAGKIEIGFNRKVERVGLINQGSFTNTPSGIIEIEETGLSGLKDVGSFNNNGKIIVGANKKPGTWGMELRVNTFTNNACGEVYVYDNILMASGGLLLNHGYFMVDNAQSHNVSQSTVTNNGILAYPQGNPIPSTANNEIIILPKSGECAPITNAFSLGGTIDFNIQGIFTDQTGNTSAGTYTQANNTVTNTTVLADGSDQVLYVKIEEPNGDCTRMVPWIVNLNDITPPTFTCPSGITVDMVTDQCYGLVPDIKASLSGSDNCGIVTFAQSVAVNTYFRHC